MKNIKVKTGIMLDIGSGEFQRPGFVNMDKRKMKGIDIVHDWEKFPWPLKDESVITAVACHSFEHVKPWLTIDWMDEVWRILKTGGQLAITVPYGFSAGYLQDPTHCNPCNEMTWTYFDPDFQYYKIYNPKPWKLQFGPTYQQNGNLEVVMMKIGGNNVGKKKGKNC